MRLHRRILKAAVSFLILLTVIVLLRESGSKPNNNTSDKSIVKDEDRKGDDIMEGDENSQNHGDGLSHPVKEKNRKANEITQIRSMQPVERKSLMMGLNAKLIAAVKSKGISAEAMEIYYNYFPVESSGYVPFVAESRNDGKGNNKISLACVSEPSITDCYEHGAVGFSSLVVTTLDHLRFCHQNNGTPTVHWRNCFGACIPNPRVDSFPFYFQPLNSGVEKNAKVVLYLGTSIMDYSIYIPNNDFPIGSRRVLRRLRNVRKFKPVLNLSFRPRAGLSMYSPTDLITDKTRNEMSFIIKKYLKINSGIENQVKMLYSKHMKDYNLLGIHVRGTDHWTESDNFKLAGIHQWLNAANTVLQRLAKPRRIFLATDNQETIERFRNYFGRNMVVYTDAIRAKGYKDEAVHVNKEHDPLQIGKQVFMDILLLAKCQYFLHSESNVASLASYFNPRMKTIFLGDMIHKAKKFFRRTLTEVTLDDYGAKYNSGKIHTQPVVEEPFEEGILDEIVDINDRTLCWKINKDVSTSPNMRSGKFIKFSDFEKYYISKEPLRV